MEADGELPLLAGPAEGAVAGDEHALAGRMRDDAEARQLGIPNDTRAGRVHFERVDDPLGDLHDGPPSDAASEPPAPTTFFLTPCQIVFGEHIAIKCSKPGGCYAVLRRMPKDQIKALNGKRISAKIEHC
jgi:hypothetical protein